MAALSPHNQLQSPLFSVLFPELRNMVFTYALTEYDDHTRPYSKHTWYYRPGFEYARKIATDLLLTCRLVYAETRLAPVALNEHVFWMCRGPAGRFVSDYEGYFERMTLEQRAAVRRVRIFTQLYWLEGRRSPQDINGKRGSERAQTWAAGLKVPKLTITIRHSDWWWWERRQPLRMKDPVDNWGAWIAAVPGLKELHFQLETLDAKKADLEERVRVARGWKFPLESSESLTNDGERPVESMWFGTMALKPWGAAQVLERTTFDAQHEERLDIRYPLELKLHVRNIIFK